MHLKIDSLNQYLNPDGIFFALKCNSLPQVLDTIAKSGCGFEVNNAAELQKALDAGVTSDRIINSSPKTGAMHVKKYAPAALDTLPLTQNARWTIS